MTQLLTIERQAQIRAMLARDGRVLAAELAETFQISEDTVRRDLREMDKAGLCRRVYGGAVQAAPEASPLGERRGQALERKSALAQAVAASIAPGSVLFIEAGSTNLAVAAALATDARLTVATNAPAVACVLIDRGIETLLVGGRVDPHTGGCLGAKTLSEAERIRPDVLILGACGIHAEAGVTAHVFEEAELKASIAARSGTIFVAATNEKLGTAAPYAVLSIERVATLFVESDCDAAALAAFETRGLAVTRAAQEPSLPADVPPRRARS